MTRSMGGRVGKSAYRPNWTQDAGVPFWMIAQGQVVGSWDEGEEGKNEEGEEGSGEGEGLGVGIEEGEGSAKVEGSI